VIGRFSNMGVDSYSLVAALTGIMAQRLVRTVCPHCAATSDESPEEVAHMLECTAPVDIQLGHVRKAVGCSACRVTGYKGRMAIVETLPIDDEMRDLLVQHAPISTIKRVAREKGFRSLRHSAGRLALRGLTTISEIDRVAPM